MKYFFCVYEYVFHSWKAANVKVAGLTKRTKIAFAGFVYTFSKFYRGLVPLPLFC